MERLGIHLAYSEIIHQAAMIAYFDSAGQEVVVIPCPDFEAFLANHLLRTRNVSFLSDLLDYILESGRRILAANEHSSSDVHLDLSWIPGSPSRLATSPSSQSLLSQRPTNLFSSQCHDAPPTCWVSSSQLRWHRSANRPSLLCHGGYQQCR